MTGGVRTDLVSRDDVEDESAGGASNEQPDQAVHNRGRHRVFSTGSFSARIHGSRVRCTCLTPPITGHSFGVETRSGYRRVRQPEERDVVQEVVSGEAFSLSGEGPGDHLQTPRVVVEHEDRQAFRRIR